MAVYKATKKKMESGGEFKATENRTIDTAMVYGWEKTYNESYDTLEKCRKRIEGGEYLSSDDLSAYEKAMNSYVDAASNMRFLSKSMGKNDIDDKEWENSVSQMRENFKGLYDHYSRWDTKEKYDSAVAANKEYEYKKNLDIEAELKEIEDWEAAAQGYVNCVIEPHWQDHEVTDEEKVAAIERLDPYAKKYGGVDVYGGITDMLGIIEERKAYINDAKRIQEGIKLASVADPASELYDPEFGQHSEYVDQEEKFIQKAVPFYKDVIYDAVNNNESGFTLAMGSTLKSLTASDFARLDAVKEMNDEERSLYNYYYAKHGYESAEKYLDSIMNDLNYRMGEAIYKPIEDKWALEMLFGVVAGFDQFSSGMKSLFSTDDYIPTSAIQHASGMVREDLADDSIPLWYNFKEGQWEDKVLGNSLGQIAYDSTTTTANMLPSMLVSTAANYVAPGSGAVVGSALLGTSAAGNAYQEMINLGYDKGQARAYAALVGGSEAGLQYLLGGIGKMGGKLTGNAVSKIVSGVDNAFARTAIKLGGSMLAEGFEEGLQEILDPWFQNLTLHTNKSVNWNDVAYSSLLGALTAGFMEGVGGAVTAAGTYRTGKSLQAAGISGQRLAEIGSTFSADSVAHQLAGKVNENTGAYTLGRLFNEIGAELTEANKAEIAQELEKRGVSAKDARVMVDAMANVVLGGSFTDKQIAILEANDVLTKAVVDVVINPNSTVNQRSQGYREVLADVAKQKTENAAQTEQVSHSGENATVENIVPAETETASQGDYEAAVEGKTIRKATGEEVSIKEVASVDAGKMTLRLEDGSEVEYRELAYSSTGEAYVFETVATLGVDAKEATRLINAFRNSGVDGKTFADGMRLAFEYGYGNFSQQELASMEVAGNIPQMYINTAYEIGQKMRQQEVEGTTKGSEAGTPKKQKSTTRDSAKNSSDTNNGKTTGKARGIYYTTKDGKAIPVDQAEKNGKLALKDKQSVAVKTAKFLQKLGLGGNYYFFESYVDSRGNRVFKDRFGNIQSAPHGLYYSDGDIYIDINAGTDSHSITLRTLSHELTHMIQQWSAAKYKAIADFLAEQYDKEGRNAYEAAKAKQAELSELRGKRVSFQEAYHEFVADSMSTLFDDGNMYDILTALKKKDKTLVDYIKKFFDGLAAKVRNLYANTQAETDEGQFVQGLSKETVYRLQQMFADALVEASENYAAREQKNTDTQIGVQHSFGQRMAQADVTKKYQAAVDQILNMQNTKQDHLVIGYTPDVYISLGMPSLPFVIGTGHIYSAAKTETEAKQDGNFHKGVHYHGLGARALKNIYEALKKPVMIVASKDVNRNATPMRSTHSVVAIVDIGNAQNSLLLPVEITAERSVNGTRMDVNALSSVYERDVAPLVKEAIALENTGDVGIYYAKKEALTLPGAGVRFPIRLQQSIASNSIIHSFSEKVNMNIADATQSQQFKRWFGDWQNHPENASKVVNADGTPMVVYHGSAEQFTEFSYGHIGSSTGVGILGDGFYFTDKKRLAKNYGDNVYPVYLQMKKPYVATESDAYKLKVADLQAKGYDGVILRAPKGDVYMVFENTQVKSATDNIGTFDGNNPDIRYQDRAATPSNRMLLAQALEGIADNMDDYQAVQEYRQIVPLLDAEEAKLSRLNAQIREMTFGKGSKDREKLAALRLEAKQTQNRIDIYDRQLLKLEATAPLQKVLEREKAKAYKRAEQKGKEAVQKERENAQAKYKELAEKNAAARKKGIESRERTAMRHKIRKVIRDLDKILNRGNKKLNVKEDMKGFVSKALELADYLFTDHISNDDLIRKGITVRMTPKEAALVKETEDILSKLYDKADSLTDEEFTRLDAKRKANEDKLRDLLTAQRNERLNTPVYNLFNDLVTEYANLKSSNQDAVKAAYDPNVERFLRSYIGESDGETDSDRKTLLQNMRVADMTTDELWKLYNAYKMVLHSVRNANERWVKGKTETIEQTAGRIMDDFSKRKIPDKKLAIIARNITNKIGWDYEKLYYALDRIGSEAFTELVMNIADSENIVMQDVGEARAFLDEVVEKYGFNSWDVNKEIDREFLDNTGKKFKLTLGELMSLYAYSRRTGAWDHIEYGGFVFGEAALTNPRPADSYKLSKEQCEAITNLLTKEQKGYAEDMQKYLSETMGAKGNEVSMLLYGIKMFGEKNYFPIHIAGQFKAQAQESQAKAAAGFGTMSNAGFTHSQNPNAKAPFVLEGFNEIWVDHINEMSRYHGAVPALEDMRRVMNRSSYSESGMDSMAIKQLMENNYGKEAVEYFDSLYREANSGAITDKLQKKSHKLLSLFRKNSVAYSLSVLIQQPASLVRAYSMVDRKYFGLKGFGAITSGVAKTVSDKWTKAHTNAYSEMLKYAPGVTMAKEIGGFDTHTGMSIRSYLLDTGKKFKQKWKTGTAKEKGKAILDIVDDNAIANLPNLADKIAWIEIWNACKRETVATQKNLTPNSEEFMQAVGDRFTEVIRATQVYDSIFAKSPMLKSKNLFVQMVVSFMNEPNTVANMAEKAVRDAIKGNWKDGLRTGAVVIHSIIFTNVLKSIIYAMRDDDEDETYIEKYIESITGCLMDDFNALNYIPVARDAWSLAQGYDVERADMAIVADALDAIEKVIKNANTDKSDMTEEDLIEFDKKVTEASWKLVESMASFFGIPVKNIRREINGVIDSIRITSANAGQTTAQSTKDTIYDAIVESIPFMSNKKSKGDKLYDAIINGDEAYVDRLKSGYKDESSYRQAVRKALRENDSRIKEAAEAKVNGDPDGYIRIAKNIIGEKNFEQDDIVAAINAQINALLKAKKSEAQ